MSVDNANLREGLVYLQQEDRSAGVVDPDGGIGSASRLGLLMSKQHRVICRANYAEQKQPGRQPE